MPVADIVLSTLNAKYIHSALGLRYLMANLGPLQARAALAEFDINHRPIEMAEALLEMAPKIVGFGVYVWNVSPTTELVVLLKRLCPELIVILGGPEVSHETEDQPIAGLADYVITGEADLEFAEVCRQLLAGRRPSARILRAPQPDLSRLALPYPLYTEADIAHRLLYVEASRGCPFKCEFCLSSLDESVRRFPLPAFLAHLRELQDRGARHFKFVDRTFNLDPPHSRAILEFLLERHRPGLFYHFEMVPDRFPDSLREIVQRFPAGSLQFEIGVQTCNPAVAERISRRQNYAQTEANLGFLRGQTSVHVHVDLVAGLPGETLESLADGFDRLIAQGPQEIQLGMLKRLRGAPIARHDAEWGMVYSPLPPYEILRNNLIDFSTMQRLRRFARYWELVGNSGNFVQTTPLLWRKAGGEAAEAGEAVSPFGAFLRWSDWLYARIQRTDSIALPRLMELLLRYLTVELGHEPVRAASLLARDYQRAGRRDLPPFLAKRLSGTEEQSVQRLSRLNGTSPQATEAGRGGMVGPRRQARHRGRG